MMVQKNQSVFQPMHRYFKKIGNIEHISLQKSIRLSDESIIPPATSDNRLAQEKITFTHDQIQ